MIIATDDVALFAMYGADLTADLVALPACFYSTFGATKRIATRTPLESPSVVEIAPTLWLRHRKKKGKMATWGPQDLYPYPDKENRIALIDNLREVIYSGWFKDQRKKRQVDVYKACPRGGLYDQGKPFIKKFFDFKYRHTGCYPNDSIPECKRLREIIHSKWLEDKAEERRRELSFPRHGFGQALGTPDKYFDEWMVINDFFLEEMANPNLRGKQEHYYLCDCGCKINPDDFLF